MNSQPLNLNTVAQNPPSRNWLRVWIYAIIKPTISNYEFLLNDPNATAKQGYLWIIMSAIISAVLSTLITPQKQSFLLTLLCAIPVMIIGAVIVLVTIAGSAYWIGHQLEGAGNFPKMIYALSTFNAPITIISVLLLRLPYKELFYTFLMVYWSWLTILSIKVVHKFSWSKALASSIVFLGIAIIGLVLGILLIKYL